MQKISTAPKRETCDFLIDPCTGTGTFIVNLIRRIADAAPQHLERKYNEDLFANEVLLLPYYVAALNIEHAYFERMGRYRPFEGLCFADTLELARGRQPSLFAERNTDRIEREQDTPIMVVIGNPPYNVGQENESDNNQNRKYPVIDGRIHDTYAKDSQATLINKLYDAYVKFFRWATDRLGDRDGIVCFVSNDSFVDQIAFDGMRDHLLRDFTQVYHLDLHGNVRKNPKISGTTHNVFGIQIGVGITIAIRSGRHVERKLFYHRVPDDWRRETKLQYLTERASSAGVEWQELAPDEKATWLTEGMQPEFASFLPLGTKEAKAGLQDQAETVFKMFSLGVATNRDEYVYSFDESQLSERVKTFVEIYNAAVDKRTRLGLSAEVDSLIDANDPRIKWTRQVKASLARGQYSRFDSEHLRRGLHRPFTQKHPYFDAFWNEERYQQPRLFPTPASEIENRTICVSTVGHRAAFTVLAASVIPNLTVNSVDGFQCFPLYTYAEDGSNRRDNITDWALARFQAAYGAGVTKRAIFDYVYGLLHHPVYRAHYAENLKRELPRVPLLPDRAAFAACVRIGHALAELHVRYDQVKPVELELAMNKSLPPDWTVRQKMKLTVDKTALVYNDWLTLAGIPPEVFRYRLGNRSALEWVIDQYQVSTDPRSQITSDPNDPANPQAIYQLIR